jgi:hypothetical protein
MDRQRFANANAVAAVHECSTDIIQIGGNRTFTIKTFAKRDRRHQAGTDWRYQRADRHHGAGQLPLWTQSSDRRSIEPNTLKQLFSRHQVVV